MPWFELACGGVPDGLMFHGGTTMPDPKVLGQTRRHFPRIAAIIKLSHHVERLAPLARVARQDFLPLNDPARARRSTQPRTEDYAFTTFAVIGEPKGKEFWQDQ